ncbi:MAG: Uma2 family endonuclease [Anaerolineae bacterium]|nr:Uma2 family endonuclease [Anaerolineae bacterium]
MKAQETAAQIKPGETTMTYEEFLEWANEDTLAEWVDGRVVMYSPASYQHQHLAMWLQTVLHLYTEAHELGEVLAAPMQVKLKSSGREPDVMFVAREHLDRIKAVYIDGPADLVIEIVSSSTANADRGEKYYEYEEAGVHEYWVIDPRPNRQRAEFYRLDERGLYQTIIPDAGVFRSKALRDFWLRVDWLWQEPLPKVMAVLKEIGFLD